MSSHSNFNQKKCWSCAFFAGNKKEKNGVFFGDSIETDSYGICTCDRSSDKNKRISETNWCSKWQLCGIVSRLQAKVESKRFQPQQLQVQQSQKRKPEQQKLQTDFEALKRMREESERTMLDAKYVLLFESLSPEKKRTRILEAWAWLQGQINYLIEEAKIDLLEKKNLLEQASTLQDIANKKDYFYIAKIYFINSNPDKFDEKSSDEKLSALERVKKYLTDEDYSFLRGQYTNASMPVGQGSINDNQASKFCANCGSPLFEQANFCGKCGVKVLV